MENIVKKIEFINAIYESADSDNEFLYELISSRRGEPDHDSLLLGIMYFSYTKLMMDGLVVDKEEYFSLFINMSYHIKKLCKQPFYHGFYLMFMRSIIKYETNKDLFIEMVKTIDETFDDMSNDEEFNNLFIMDDRKHKDLLEMFINIRKISRFKSLIFK